MQKVRNSDKARQYGTVLAIYTGSGTLTYSGAGAVPCSFCTFQLNDGHVVLLCEADGAVSSFELLFTPTEAFIGHTEEGQVVTASGLTETNYLPEVPRENLGSYFAYRVRKLAVETPSDETTSVSRFAVTNVILLNRELRIEHPLGRAELRRIAEYEAVVKRMRTVKSTDVTAELKFEGNKTEVFESIADDVCYLLSLARGTKIQWICRDDCAPSGNTIRRFHFSRVTKPYCPLAVIDPREVKDTPDFLSDTMATYVARREKWGLSRGLIDAFLDAKAENDYLETRAAKLAIAMEMLKASFLESSKYADVVKSKHEFRRLIPLIKEALKKALSDRLKAEERAVLYRNIEELNRVPFKDLLEALCSHLEISVSDEDLQLFVRCRNSLVHTGRFYSMMADGNERAAVKPHRNPSEEYFWLVHFLDRLFLRLVGYRGPYVDWSHPEKPLRRKTF